MTPEQRDAHYRAIDLADEALLNPSCPCCGGDLVPLGQLGRLIHYRCRQCGAQTSESE